MSDERDLEVERGVRLELLVRVSIRNDDEHELRVTLNGSGRGSQRASTAADLGTVWQAMQSAARARYSPRLT